MTLRTGSPQLRIFIYETALAAPSSFLCLEVVSRIEVVLLLSDLWTLLPESRSWHALSPGCLKRNQRCSWPSRVKHRQMPLAWRPTNHHTIPQKGLNIVTTHNCGSLWIVPGSIIVRTQTKTALKMRNPLYRYPSVTAHTYRDLARLNTYS